MGDIDVTIVLGPLSWFQQQLGQQRGTSLLEWVYRNDERKNVLTVANNGDLVERPRLKRPKLVFAESGDYASLNEHVISNFMGLVRSMRPKKLLLHNPPVHVQTQIVRSIPSTQVLRYDYPRVTPETLKRFDAEFGDRMVGQAKARERLLAALYPLTRQMRATPAVVMFYGPSGVGKTQTAQFVNGLLGGTLLRKQFSMFHSEKFASYLFGGSHSEPSLAKDLLDRESGVILIDEFDKANPVFHSAFYQLFDGGIFDDKNYSVNVGPSLIVCTSNYATDGEVQEALGEALYSRFDAVIAFEHLAADEVAQLCERIVDAQLEDLPPAERNRIDRDRVLDVVGNIARQTGNVRKLGKLVEETLSTFLVRDLLEASHRDEAPGQGHAPGASVTTRVEPPTPTACD